MWRIVTPLLFLSSALALWPGAAAQPANNQTIRIEMDPDPSTVTGPCSDDFMASLTAKISLWFTNGVSSFKGAYPQVDHPYITFNNTVKRGGGSKDGGRRASQQEPPQFVTNGKQEEEQRGLVCSTTSCTNCCPSYCTTFCNVGPCNLCGGGRKLRKGVVDPSRRTTAGSTEAWWWGDDILQFAVAKAIQFAAQQWLFSNDPTQCMGNAWKLQVTVNFV